MSHHVDWTMIDWEDLHPRLLLVATKKLKRLFWRGGAIPGGKTADDFVQDAIAKTLEWRRPWNGDCTLFKHLVGIISGDISHWVMSAENRRTVRSDEKVIQIKDPRHSPETEAIQRAQVQHFFSFLEGKRPDLRLVAEFMLCDPDGSSHKLALKLGLSLTEVDSLKRALRRAIEQFLGIDGSPENTLSKDKKHRLKTGESHG
jgi:DNA-directed RNA polymerase specialized sigma24 family protein